MSSAIRAAILLICVLTAGFPLAAKDHALVIGISRYTDPNLADLEGAANDAHLFADLARRSGVEDADLSLLAGRDRIVTARAIGDAFARLLEVTRPGDRALVLLSGHGIAMRDAAALHEDDGLTEAFLAGDAQYDRASGTWSGAIRDDSLAQWFGALQRKGVDVLLIADFCESGGALRSSGRSQSASPRFARLLASETEAGSFAALLAAPQGQAARQGLGPPWKPLSEQRPHGLLSLYTVLALEEAGLSTMGEMADWVAVQIARHSASPPSVFVGDRTRPHPMALRGGGRRETRWKATLPPTAAMQQAPAFLPVEAGSLAGLFDGAPVELVDIAPGGEKVMARGRVTGASILSARFHPDPADPDPRWLDLRRADGSRPLDGGTFFIQLRRDVPQAEAGPMRQRSAMLAAAEWASERPGNALEVAIATIPASVDSKGACLAPEARQLDFSGSTALGTGRTDLERDRCATLLFVLRNASPQDRYVQLAGFAPNGDLLLLPEPGPEYHLLAPGEELRFGYQLTDPGREQVYALSIDADYPLAERRLLRSLDPLRSAGPQGGGAHAPGALQAVALEILVGG